MFDSPVTLREYCLGFIRDSVSEQVNERPVEESEDTCQHVLSSHCPLISNLNSCHLTCNLSESLLSSLSEEGKLTDQVMQEVFLAENCRLENVTIPDASNLSKKGLRVLRSHRIDQLQVIGLTKATINELIGCLGEYSLNQLNLLNVSKSTFTSSARFCVVVGLAKLRNLRTLDISHTDINHHGLDIIVEDLPLLQSLNISATRVRDLTPLKKMKHRLKSLSMYNLKSMSGGSDEFIPILLELNQLVKLDMSEDRESPVDVLTHTSNGMSNFMRRPELFPHLKYLDISGKDGIDLMDLKRFISHKHKLGDGSRLTFLGLMQTDVCTDDSFFESNNDESYHEIMVTGSATEVQIMNSLRMYGNRPAYIQKSLCYLYNYTINDIKEPRIDMIDMIIPVMRKHKDVIGIQMAATACLYNLTKGKVGDKIHPKWLAAVVNATLSAMSNFPNHQQLQKNTLLTLCSDRILQEVTFDRFKCAKLVMESLVNFKDPSMNRMAVAVCSILAAKISTAETSALGAKPVYMETLLQIVRTRVAHKTAATASREEPDIMLKFTLSALWNLTDESPSTCAMFLEKGGIGLYLEVLSRFDGHSSVETKILGLLNNIAEVACLRANLIEIKFMASLQKLLNSSHIDVSYFAAGIFAHLMSDVRHQWICPDVTRSSILNDLVKAILAWKSPEIEMVAYRSFNPFLPLLQPHVCHEVQLWAVWAIHHVCSKNPSRYCDMLLEGQTLKLFQGVRRSAICNNNHLLMQFCQLTVDVIRKEHPHLSTDLE